MASSDFLSFAGGSGANVLSQADYAALAALATGFSAGVAQSAEVNKVLRQSSIMSAVVAQFICDRTGQNVVDDGTTVNILAQLKSSAAAVSGDAAETFAVAPATQPQHAAQLGQTNSLIATSRVPVRQTVLTGVADANGYAAFLQVGTGLAVNLLATASPLVPAFAAGFGANGEADYVGQITADVASAWSGLPANTTSYLYVDRNPTTSVLTYGASSLTPAYQDAAPGSPATDQHWFSPLTMVMQRWSGSAWVAVQRVFVGRAVAGTSTITAVTVYAFKGKYLSQLNALPSGSSFTATHALGVCPRHFEIFLVNITSELGYSVGSRIPLPYVDNGTATISAASDTLNGTVSATPAGIALAFVNTGVRSAITAANWNIQFAVDRGW